MSRMNTVYKLLRASVTNRSQNAHTARALNKKYSCIYVHKRGRKTIKTIT